MTHSSTVHDSNTASDLLYSDTEEALRESVRGLFAGRLSPQTLNAAYDDASTDFSSLWKTLAAELGVAGLLIAEDLGGAGASEREAAVVMEEIGRAVAPVPFLSSAILATVALTRVGDTATLGRLADGSETAVLAVSFATDTASAGFEGVEARDGVLTGRVTSVAGGTEATTLVVPATRDGRPALYVVDATAPGVTLTPVPALDMTRPLVDVDLSGAVPSREYVDGASESVRAALLTGVALLASEQVGIAQWCLETTVAYVKDRKQFGRAIGSFQAIKHRLADLWLQVSSANAAARYAADTAARGDADAEIAARIAGAYCGDVAVKAAEECIQLHGGIGMTWEYPAHLYLKRAKSAQLALGTGYAHRARLAELVDLTVTAG
ncbi:MAG TPA: acyl-CoA dehydrogenase family protein [Aldersonia sp.]